MSESIRLREAYTPNAFDVKLGLSGWAQLKNKRAHNPENKAKLDLEYVKNLSLWLDIKIFVLTVFRLFGSGKGK
ncbi:MAG: sugar transferase [Bacilli bacterium]|nr:sugar transferase [Bacilli bacterium]